MPLRSKIARGTIQPGEMVFLQEIFDDECRASEIPTTSRTAEIFAAALVEAFLEGIRDPDELRSTMLKMRVLKVS